MVTARSENLDVALLLDDPSEFSGEREGNESFLFVSEAVEAIEGALARLGHRARHLPFTMGLRNVIASLYDQRPDVVFALGQPIPTDPACEAHVTGLLDLLGIAHTSESAETLVLARDKVRAKALFAQHQIPTPAFAVSSRGELPRDLPPPPWIAKPSLEDGSVGIHCLVPAAERPVIGERIRDLHQRFDEPILIETFTGARELQVGLIGSEILPIIEIDFSELPADRPRMTGHETKWNYDSVEFKGVHYKCPAPLTDAENERLRELARKAAHAFGIQRCSRLDVRMDREGRFFLIDVNPNPDLSPIATMHAMARVAGFGFDGLIQRLLDLARTPRMKGR
jgi:D-alanine-D-alanine ligase